MTFHITDKLLNTKLTDINDLVGKYVTNSDWSISDIVGEYDFNSMMKAKLLNFILNLNSRNSRISSAVDNFRSSMPEIFEGSDVKFVFKYDKDILKFRNKLAHVKRIDAKTPVFIGAINGIEYFCNEEFCTMIRSTLIKYSEWFEKVNKSFAQV